MANPLRTLQEYGQSVWLDFVSRDLLMSGGLAKLITEDGLRGVTSNPSIFEKAIGHGDDYDALIAAAEGSGDLDPGALFEDLAVRDIQEGADTLNPVYEQTQRRDGFISLEVSPYLAMNTHETIEEARRLWREVNRRNLMIKVPGTKPGLTAIRTLIGEGINVNVTLLFSQQVYSEVAEAYISGLDTVGMDRMSSYAGAHIISHVFEQMTSMLVTTLAGVFERFPSLRLGFLEAGCGWAPTWVDRIEEHFERAPDDFRGGDPHGVINTRSWLTFELEEPALASTLELGWADNVMFASDYPHFDAVFPGAIKAVKERGLPDGLQRKVLGENALRFYGRRLQTSLER